MLLAADVGLARLALGVEGIELLFEPLLRRLAGHSERGRREGLAAPRLPQPLAAIFGCSPLDARSRFGGAARTVRDVFPYSLVENGHPSDRLCRLDAHSRRRGDPAVRNTHLRPTTQA